MLMQKRNRLSYVGKLSDAHNRDFYGTPRKWIELSRRVMGGIELDPASCEVANQHIVKADRYFDESMDALKQDWYARTLFLNPPYGRSLRKFADKFRSEWEAGRIGQAIILVNNTTETGAFDQFARCSSAQAQPRRRIQFVGVDGRRSDDSNTRGQVFFYCGGRLKTFSNAFRINDCRVLSEV